MSRYGHICFILIVLFLFHLGSSQLPSNQITTMIRLYDMLKNSTVDSAFPWSMVRRDSSPCTWKGVSCSSSNSSVAKLSLSRFSISSPEILPVLCQIDTLESLDVSNNHLSSIPDGFITGCAGISGLKLLNFGGNKLVGSLPTFNGFQLLEFLDLSRNLLNGSITLQLDGLDSLKSLNISYNEFTGPLPTNLGKKNLLQDLQLSNNMFQGEIPAELVKYGNLSLIDLSRNSLSGSIPDKLGELSKLQILVLSANNLSGRIPNSLLNVQTLLRFAANQNGFTGNIPAGITTYLKILDLSYNNLNGTIPQDLFSPPNLQSVDLSSNSLEGPIPSDISSSLYRLRLGGNSLNGTIPSGSFESLTNLIYLELDSNSLTGVIPPQLGVCRSLALLNLAQNRLTGVLPTELGNLTSLKVIYLQQNNLVGTIPDQFTQFHSLLRMNISSNSINGSIPDSVSRMWNLTNLDLSNNNLSGSIPTSIGSLNFLLELQLGNNKLRGDIPAMPSSLQIALNLSSNFFEGPIPMTLSRLIALEVLDLSNNKFSGVIPLFLTRMIDLTQLVLSNNQLSGEKPKFGPYVVVVTNGNAALHDPPPPSNAPPASPKRKRTVSIGLVISFSSGFVFSFRVIKIIASSKCSSRGINGQWIGDPNMHKSNLNFTKVMEIIHRPTNILFKGEFYIYYKALMPCGMNFCIKRFYWTSKTFTLVSPDKFAEEIKKLNQLKNSNIMIPLAYAFTSQNAFVVYECPQYGTLFDLLHGCDQNVLTWGNRYTIAVGLASGLAFLHSLYGDSSATVKLIHISTRSIFMRSLSEPLIGDIELIEVIDPSKSLGTLSVVAGAVGYVPPEYAYTMRVTKSGNIYSVGTILLELLTGKKAVNEGVELAKWALRKSIQDDQFEEILDCRISITSLEAHRQMVSMFRIAMSCVSICPEERPNAKELQAMILDVAQ